MDRLANVTHRTQRLFSLSGRVQTLVIASALVVGVCLLATAGIAEAAPAEAAHAAIAAKSAAAASGAIPHPEAAPDPMLQRIVAGGVTTLLFGTMISVVVVSWRSFRESIERDQKARKDRA
ncbi:hypothetical protein [Amorphus coralli]|uniref:hypothetical protein n=1 Tax=Amorphus coralli TaxID=340680 RepID=UPI000380E2D4|nr:hypothetical protein [Amorphus coralli]